METPICWMASCWPCFCRRRVVGGTFLSERRKDPPLATAATAGGTFLSERRETLHWQQLQPRVALAERAPRNPPLATAATASGASAMRRCHGASRAVWLRAYPRTLSPLPFSRGEGSGVRGSRIGCKYGRLFKACPGTAASLVDRSQQLILASVLFGDLEFRTVIKRQFKHGFVGVPARALDGTVTLPLSAIGE